MFDTDNNKEENQNFYKEAINEVLNGENVDDVYIKYISKCKRWAYSTQGLRDISKAKKNQMINLLKNIKRY